MKKTLSILKEIRSGEKRVILTPDEICKIVSEGYQVIAEHNCGEGCGFSDIDYQKAGAEIVNQRDAWKLSDFIVKYKAPMDEEYKYFSPNKTIAALFHAEGNHDLLKAMMNAKLTAYSFEFFETDTGVFPLAFPGGEIAGKSAVLYAAHYLQNHFGGKGKLLCDIVGVPKPRIGIIGYGSVGSAAISLAVSLGCEVIVFGSNIEKMRKLQITFGNNIEVLDSNKENYEKILPTLDVLIGAILISTFDTPTLITETMIKKMAQGSLIVDVTCGYGNGYLPFIKGYTTLQNPIKTSEGLNYIKIDNLPSAYHLTTTIAYAKNLMPYLLRLMKSFSGAISDNISSRGCILKDGEIVHKEIQKHWNYYEKN
jgi:alanine dehydrogenase